MCNVLKLKPKVMKRKKKPKLSDVFKTHIREFFLMTSLHGYKYVMKSKLPKFERYIWGTIVVSLLCCSLIAMTKAWTYNSIHSTLAVIQTTHHGVWNYLFPAVTVCNHNLVSLKKARKFVNELKYLQGFSRDYVLKEMQLLAEMVDPGIFGYDVYFNLTALQNVFHANNYTAAQIMKLVKQDCSVLLRNCKWRGETESCEDIFEEVYVRDGICCSFNFFHNNTKINNGRIPQQVSACGYQTALSFEVHPEPEDYHAALYPSYGVKTLIHYPYDHPYRNCQYKLISLGVQNFMNVKPQEFYSTQSTKSLPLRSRQCLSENDQVPEPLQLLMRNYTMLKYTYINCLTNCRTSVVVNECGCAPFYVPQNHTRVCNLRDLICMKKIQRLYDMSWPTLDMYSDDLLEADIDITTRPCGCLPDCTIYSYPLYSTQAHLQKAYTSSRLSEDAGNFGNFSIINVFYEDLVTTRYRRDVNFTWNNIIASFGGLLSLFVGLSATTIFELTYFFFTRPFVDKFVNNRRHARITSLF